MTIDRRAMLRGAGRVTAAGTIGAALAASPDLPRRPADLLPPTAPAHPVASSPVRWASALRPSVVPRSGWRTDPVRSHRLPHPCAPGVKAVFVHHTDSGNDYTRADVPRLIQSFYDGHIEDNAWDDIGYNFLVDRMGTVYEGRAGGVDNAVIGAHTLGFNIGTVGIAAIGSFGTGAQVPEPMLEAMARLAAWKLGLYDVYARAATVLVSTSDYARYPKGGRGVFHVVSGHRDGYQTTCPGDALYAALPRIREQAARLQDRARAHGTPARPPAYRLRMPT